MEESLGTRRERDGESGYRVGVLVDMAGDVQTLLLRIRMMIKVGMKNVSFNLLF